MRAMRAEQVAELGHRENEEGCMKQDKFRCEFTKRWSGENL